MTKEVENQEVEVEEKKVLRGKEESIIKYALITLGGILLISLLALIIISAIPEKAIAIGNKKITKDEFIYYYKQQADIILEYKEYVAPDIEDYAFLMAEYTNGVTYSQAAAQRALATILETYVLNDLANGKDPDFTYDKAELEDSVATFEKDFKNYADENEIKVDEAANALYGCSYKVLIKAYEMSWIATKYQADRIDEIETGITEEEMQTYYETFNEDLDSVTVRHILIASFDTATGEDYTEEQVATAKAKAEEAYNKILEGSDFLEVALEYSEDPGVVENEGVYSFKKSETELTEFAEWAFAAEIDDVGFVESYVGYHVIELMDRTTYDDLAETVKYNIAYGELTKELQEIEQTDDYLIGYYDGYYDF